MGTNALEAFAVKMAPGGEEPKEPVKEPVKEPGGEEKDPAPVEPPAEDEEGEEEVPALDEESKKELAELNKAGRKKLEAQFLSTPRGQRYKDAMVALRDLGAPESEGGIGFIPTKDELLGFYDSHQILGDLRLAWASGTPEGAEQILGAFLGPQEGEDGKLRTPDQAKALAKNLFPVLRQKYPQAANEVSASVLARYLSGLEARIEKQSDEDEKKGMQRLLRALRYDLMGKEEPEEKAPKVATPAPRGKTPEEKELEYYRKRAAEGQREDETRFMEDVNNAVFENLVGEMKGLDGLKETLSEIAFERVLNGVTEDVLSQVKTKAPNGYREFNRQVGVYRGTQKPEDLQKAIGIFSRIAKPYLVEAQRRAIRSQAKTNEEQARTSGDQRRSAEKRAPAGGGVPGSVVDGKLARQPGETVSAWRERVFANALGQGG